MVRCQRDRQESAKAEKGAECGAFPGASAKKWWHFVTIFVENTICVFYSVKQKGGIIMKTAVIRARVPEKLKKEFEDFASSHGWNLSQAIRLLMNQYVLREKELNIRRLETLEALEDMETGRVVDGDKVLEWLDTWGTDDETTAPR